MDLTIFTATGEVTYEEWIEALKAFYEGSPTKNVLWDQRGLTGQRISSEELEKIITFLRSYQDRRPTGKTALVGTSDLDFELASQTHTLAETKMIPWKIKGFRSLEEGVKWISSDEE